MISLVYFFVLLPLIVVPVDVDRVFTGAGRGVSVISKSANQLCPVYFESMAEIFFGSCAAFPDVISLFIVSTTLYSPFLHSLSIFMMYC